MGFLQRLFGRDDDAGEGEGERQRSMSKEDSLAGYVIREHKLGRSVDDILDDPYLKNRANEEQRLRLLERPEVIRAIGEDTAEMAKARVRGS